MASSNDSFRTQILALVHEELSLLLQESEHAPDYSLPLPSGRDKRLFKICQAILNDPGNSRSLEEWAHHAGASKRTMARLFQSEFGVSYLTWRQQVRIVVALSRLAQGDPVTIIAGDLGYETPAAFSLMFRRATGLPPSKYAAVAAAHHFEELPDGSHREKIFDQVGRHDPVATARCFSLNGIAAARRYDPASWKNLAHADNY